MRMRELFSPSWRLVPALLSVFQLLVVLIAAHDQPGKGYHSSRFDPKYNALRDLLVTPSTHPHLYRFTGRWTVSRNIYRATTWPGTSVTILTFGSYCSIKLRPQSGLGRIETYSYYISIDGGEDYRYDLPAFDTGKEGEGREMSLFVPVKFDIQGDGYTKPAAQQAGKVVKRDRVPTSSIVERDGKLTATLPQLDKEEPIARKLTPHTIRITSNPHTPFRFEGVLTENVLIRQSWGWAKRQDERVTVEFIGEGIDAERLGGMGLTGGWTEITPEGPTSNSQFNIKTSSSTKPRSLVPAPALIGMTQYQAAERLAIRHWHTSAGVCLTANCNPKNPLPGLQTQYFQLNPLNHSLPFTLATNLPNTHPKHPKTKLDPYLFSPKQPTFPQSTPTHLVVDLGIADIIIHRVDPVKYQKELTLFLCKLRLHAYPAANILVLARQDAPGKSSSRTHANDNGDAAAESDNENTHVWFRSIIPTTPDTVALRKKLFDATKAAVAAARQLHPPQPKAGLPGTITFIPVLDTGANPVNDLVRALCVELGPAAKLGSKTVEVCGEMVSGVRRRGFVWDVLFLVLGVGMAVVARDTFMGAMGAVVAGLRSFWGGAEKGKGKSRAAGDIIREEEELVGGGEKGKLG
ncbi:hypothetical protein EV426DRAFT_597528 [Tirmania nivea]|nr:hypothetical protein EV426DRAFT_597528 [Tirmania nivea]